MMSPIEEKKKKLEEAIVETMITALEQNKITEFRMSQMSAFVLDGIDGVQTQEQLQKFVHDLAVRWDIFKSIEILEKAEMDEKIEDEVAQGVLLLLEHGKIDNAIKLARSVTHTQEIHNQN